jgi:sec-independent protein translocase protein TatB
MFNVGGGEILVILLVALLVLGPDKLPEAARNAGRFYRQVRQMSSGFQQEIREAMGDEPRPSPTRPTVHPDAGPGPSLPPVGTAPGSAGADGSVAGASVPDPAPSAGDAGPVRPGTPTEPDGPDGSTVHVEGPGTSFS